MVVIRIIFVLITISMLSTASVTAQVLETEYALIFIEDGSLFRYQNGVVEPVCGIPLIGDDRGAELTVQYSERYDVAYAPKTGLVALAVRNQGPFTDWWPGSTSPEAATALYLCDVNTGDFERISPDPVVGFMHISPVFSPDETRLVWLAHSTTTQVLLYDIASKQVTSVYQSSNPLQDIPPLRYRNMRPLVWGDAGVLFRGEFHDVGEMLITIDPENGTIMEQSLFPDDVELPVIAYHDLLTWATADDRHVVVYALGSAESRTFFYYDPNADEHFIGSGVLMVSPVAPLPVDWAYNQLPTVMLLPFNYPLGTEGLIAFTPGPSTFNGMPGGFAFSPDGRYLAMLVNEGLNLQDGNDIYVMGSEETYGALGYSITAQRVGTMTHDWDTYGPQAVFWGRSDVTIDGFMPGFPLTKWSPNG